MSLLNTANAGFFSSDRSVKEYADRIWKMKPVNYSSQATAEKPVEKSAKKSATEKTTAGKTTAKKR